MNRMDVMKIVITAVSGDIESCKKSTDKTKSIMKNNAELRNNIQQEISTLQDEIISKAQEIITVSKSQMENLEKEYKEMENQLETLGNQQKRMESMQTKLNSANSVKELALAIAEADDLSSDFKKEHQSFEALISKNENMCQNIEKTLKKRDEKIREIGEVVGDLERDVSSEIKNTDPQSGTVEQSTQARHPFTIRQPPVSSQPQSSCASPEEPQQAPKQHAVTKRHPVKITPESLLNINGQVKTMIENGRAFVIQDHQGEQRCAVISIHENKYLCLQSLRKGKVPLNVSPLKFEDVIQLIKPSSRLTFLEFKNVVKDKVLGKIIINLTPNTKKGENFFLLCSAEKGPSYRNSGILVVGHRDTEQEGIWMGDYEKKFGDGGMSLVPGAGTEKGCDMDQPWLAGTLGSSYGNDSTAAQFGIITRDIPGQVLNGCFGKVELGLNVLTDALQLYPNFEDEVIVSDCGVVLNTI